MSTSAAASTAAPGVTLLSASERHNGMSIRDMAEDWMRWILSLNLDMENNSDEIRYLRGLDFPGPDGSYAYIRRGNDRHYVKAGETIICLVTGSAHAEQVKEGFETPHQRTVRVLEMKRLGKFPPSPAKVQVSKDGQPSKALNAAGYEEFVVMTGDIQVEIPDYDPSNRNYLGEYFDTKLNLSGPTLIRAVMTLVPFRLEKGQYTITWTNELDNGYVSEGHVMIDSVDNTSKARILKRIDNEVE